MVNNTFLAIIFEARAFAIAAHEAVGQKRKYTDEPYYYHPLEVANILVTNGCTNEEIIAAAYLHDVIEDTHIKLPTITGVFGDNISELVHWLTDISRPEDGNRAERKRIDREHIAQAPAEAQTIKLADIISNTSTIVKHDPEFAKIYLAEKELLLDVLTKGDQTLWQRAKDNTIYRNEEE